MLEHGGIDRGFDRVDDRDLNRRRARGRLTDSFKLIRVEGYKEGGADEPEVLKRGTLADVLQWFGAQVPTGGPAGSWFLHDGNLVGWRILPDLDRRVTLRAETQIGELPTGERITARIEPPPPASAADRRPQHAHADDRERKTQGGRR